ncbi:MAG: DUF2975 domain-containing protein [Cellulosilyticaceae bacterium]
MKDNFLSQFLYGLCILALGVLTVMLIGLPWLTQAFLARPSLSSQYYYYEFLVLLYITGAAAWVLVWHTKNLAKRVIKREPFTEGSLKNLKMISLCAAFVCLCYIVSMFFIQYRMLYLTIEVGTIIVGSFMVALIGSILYKLVQVAIELKEENELTI